MSIDIPTARGPFHQNGLTLITAWISDNKHHNMWDEITCPSRTSTVQALTFRKDKWFHPTFYQTYAY